jgi:hypothetical protein
MHLQTLLLPSPRSHGSATGPRSKTQPINTRNTQRKTTRALAARAKPVRPVLQIVTPVSPRKPPKNNKTKNKAKELQTRRNLDQGTPNAERPRERRTPFEGGVDPRARRSLLEVSAPPRTGRSPPEGGAHPRARRSLLEGIFEWAALVGRWGLRGVGHVLHG